MCVRACVYTCVCMCVRDVPVTPPAQARAKPARIALTVTPLKPVARKLYRCDSAFATESLSAGLVPDACVGYVVMDGTSTLVGTVSGSARAVLHHMRVTLPKKHRRGGQSSVRFARLREEARGVYVRKVSLCQCVCVCACRCLPVPVCARVCVCVLGFSQ